eukprot:GABV01013703.1.p2 GENE.GABV01013703.1~~GABV01013703.1.p2  ORF type:complete len:124 (-),score=45.96 GABV01013703.1:3-374(-)
MHLAKLNPDRIRFLGRLNFGSPQFQRALEQFPNLQILETNSIKEAELAHWAQQGRSFPNITELRVTFQDENLPNRAFVFPNAPTDFVDNEHAAAAAAAAGQVPAMPVRALLLTGMPTLAELDA